MKVRNENEILLGGRELKSRLREGGIAAGSFFLSVLKIGGLTPWGLSAVGAGGSSAVIGALLGYFLFSKESLRYMLASLFAYGMKRLLCRKIPIKAAAASFFFTVWGTLLSEIVGFFTLHTTFDENMRFALSGILSGIGAGVIHVAFFRSEALSSEKRSFTFFCRMLTASAILSGMAAIGESAFISETAYTVAIIFVFYVGRREGLLHGAVGCGAIVMFFLMNEAYDLPRLISLLGVGITASLLREYSGFYTLAAGIFASLLALIYSGGSSDGWKTLISTTAGLGICISIPKERLKRIQTVLFPEDKKGKNKERKFRFLLKSPDCKNGICDRCEHRLRCWVKDSTSTHDAFTKLSEGKDIPDYFRKRCPHISDLYRYYGKEKESGGCTSLDYSGFSIVKRGENATGDNTVICKGDEGKYLFGILDGMGSGDNAANQSEKCARLLRQLAKSGIEKTDALEFLNTRLLSEKSEQVLGADISVIRLKDSVLETVKAGAAPTYIIRGGRIFELGSGSLPLGILDEIYPESNRFRLKPKDNIIMVSDGFLSEGTDSLGRMIFQAYGAGHSDSLDSARQLASLAEKKGYDLYDDLSVIWIRVA